MSRRRPVHLLGVVVVCALLDGVAGVLIGLTIAGALALGVRPRQLVLAAAATLGLATAHALLVGLPDLTRISTGFVVERLLTHHLAFGAFALLVVGVLAEDLGGPARERPEA